MRHMMFVGDIVVDENTTLHNLPSIRDAYVVGNLEAGLRPPNGTIQKKNKISLFSAHGCGETLRQMGMNCLTLANNHIADFGGASIELTQESLRAAGISYFGAGTMTDAKKPLIVELDGTTVAFLGMVTSDSLPILASDANEGVAEYDENLVRGQLRRLKDEVDHVVIYIHWGLQYTPLPPPVCVTTGRKLLDAGADLIIGGHPHVVQGYEIHSGKYIFYSLGNFYFNDMWTSYRGGPMFLIHPSDSAVSVAPVFAFSREAIQLVDIRVFNQCQKGVLVECRGWQKSRKLKYIKAISQRIGTMDEEQYGDWLEAYRLKEGLLNKLRNITKVRLEKKCLAKGWKLMAYYGGRGVQRAFGKM